MFCCSLSFSVPQDTECSRLTVGTAILGNRICLHCFCAMIDPDFQGRVTYFKEKFAGQGQARHAKA